MRLRELHQLPLTLLQSSFCRSGTTYAKFCHPSMRQEDFPSTFLVAGRLSVNFPCIQETFRKLPSRFHVAWRCSVNFCQLSVQPEDFLLTSVNFPCHQKTFRQLPSTFHADGRLSVNFRQQSVWLGELPSTFCLAGRTSVNILFS